MAQARSQNTYQKINGVFKRDENTVIIPAFSDDAFEFLRNCKFAAEEKIDGTNIRIQVTGHLQYSDTGAIMGVFYDVEYLGKTDDAYIPGMLLTHLTTNYPKDVVLNALGLQEFVSVHEWKDHNWVDEDGSINVFKVPYQLTIYGEGYGVGIGPGGKYLKDSNSFIGFDVKIGDWWLHRYDRDVILNKMGCPIVPSFGFMTIDEAIEYVRHGFPSKLNVDAIGEGLVLRPDCGLKNRKGERIILKIKYKDFMDYRNKHKKEFEVPKS